MTTVLSTIPSSTTATPATAAITSAEEAPTGETAEATSTPEMPVVPTETKPDPDLEIAHKLEKVSRKEAHLRKQEIAFQTRETRLAEREKAIDAKLAELESALEDPIEYAIKKGKDPVEITKRIARPITEEEKRIAKLEAQYAKDAEERKQAEEESKKHQTAQQRRREMAEFVSGITPDEYPHITSVYEAKQIPDLVQSLMSRPHDPTDPEGPTVLQVFRATYDRAPTPKEIRDALEHEAETYAMSLIERLKPKSASSQVTPSTPPAIEESTSLSNQHAANSPSARSGTKSREERMRELKEQLEAEAATTD